MSGFEISSFITLMAPARIPATAQQRLSDEVTRIAQTPQFLEHLKGPLMYSDVADYKKVAAEAAAEAAGWKRMVDLIRNAPAAASASR